MSGGAKDKGGPSRLPAWLARARSSAAPRRAPGADAVLPPPSPPPTPLCSCCSCRRCSAPDHFNVHKLRKGRWERVLLRVGATGIERFAPGGGAVRWRLLYRHASSPAGGGRPAAWQRGARGSGSALLAAARAASTALAYSPLTSPRPSLLCSPPVAARRGPAPRRGRFCAVWQGWPFATRLQLPRQGGSASCAADRGPAAAWATAGSRHQRPGVCVRVFFLALAAAAPQAGRQASA